jgi:hypothetical protein
MNVQPHKTNTVTSHNGKAIIVVQASTNTGTIEVSASSEGVNSETFKINVN